MSPERRTLAVWGGVAAGTVALGWIWLAVRAGQVDEARAESERLRATLADSWLPDRPQEAERYAKDLQESQRRQQEALRLAETQLVPELKREYQATDLVGAQARLRTDVVALRARAERSRIGLPGSLPFEGGFDQDEAVRAQQLVSLCAVRSALDLCLDAGVAQIGACAVGRASCDAGGAVAVFPLELEVEAAPEAVQALLQAFAAAHRQGLGLRRVEIDGRAGAAVQPGKAASQRVRLTATLLVRNRSEWQLRPDGAKPAARAAGLGRAPAEKKP